MRINQDIEEKPNHQHYPACLGRKREIDKQSFEIFVYTAAIFFIFSLFSIMGAKFNIFAVLPDLLFKGQDTKIAFFQVFEFIIVTVISLLGCTKYKIFDVIIMLMYVLMIIMSIFFKYSSVDAVVFIAGACGIWKSFGSLRMWSDYEQLSQTEGFPIFSIILTEHDEKDQYGGNSTSTSQSVFDNTLSQLDPSTDLAQSLMKAAATTSNDPNNMGMPSINAAPLPVNKYTMKRYLPEGEKDGGILESPMKFNI